MCTCTISTYICVCTMVYALLISSYTCIIQEDNKELVSMKLSKMQLDSRCADSPNECKIVTAHGYVQYCCK